MNMDTSVRTKYLLIADAITLNNIYSMIVEYNIIGRQKMGMQQMLIDPFNLNPYAISIGAELPSDVLQATGKNRYDILSFEMHPMFASDNTVECCIEIEIETDGYVGIEACGYKLWNELIKKSGYYIYLSFYTVSSLNENQEYFCYDPSSKSYCFWDYVAMFNSKLNNNPKYAEFCLRYPNILVYPIIGEFDVFYVPLSLNMLFDLFQNVFDIDPSIPFDDKVKIAREQGSLVGLVKYNHLNYLP